MGRPAFQPTEEQRKQVTEWRAAHVGTAEIARRLGTNKMTLLKYFRAELGGDDAAYQRMGKKGEPAASTAFSATPEQREVVEILAAVQMPVAEIATRLGLTKEIIEEHFRAELAEGPAKKNAEVFSAVYRSAVAGSNSAQRLWIQITTVAQPKGARANEDESAPSAPANLGKKVSDQLAANRIAASGGKYAPPPAPKLIVDNAK